MTLETMLDFSKTSTPKPYFYKYIAKNDMVLTNTQMLKLKRL